MIKYTDEQRKLIELNSNVIKCGSTGISFKKEFKLKAVKEYLDGMSASVIFTEAGFDRNLIGKNIPKERVRAWSKNYKEKGEVGLLKDGRGNNSTGRPKTKGLSEKDRIEYLEAQVEYLKAENDFLAKLRAKKKAE